MARVCVHLDQSTDRDYAKSFSGVGTEYALICPGCRAAPETIATNLREVTPERFARIEEDGSWEWDRDAILGRPQVLERPTGLSFVHEEVVPERAIAGNIADLKPINASVDGDHHGARRFLTVTSGGGLRSSRLVGG
jgi:hypothetical protein